MVYLELLIVFIRGVGWVFVLLSLFFGLIALMHERLNDYTLLIWPAAAWVSFFTAKLLKSLE